jgi:hypothetical protein
MAADVWARCGECRRWFFVEHAAIHDARCPVCGCEPVEVIDRAADVQADILRIANGAAQL